jgi:hypothetical protein
VTDIRGLKPLLRLEPPAAWWLLAIVAALAFAWGLSWLRSRRAAGPDTAATAPPDPGWTTAEWLDDLAARGWMQPDQAAAFHGRLASIVRAHLEAARGVPAGRMTTSEAIEATATAGGDDEASRVARVLAACDAVKFAGAIVDSGGMADTLQEARALVASQGNPVLGGVGRPAGQPREETP